MTDHENPLGKLPDFKVSYRFLTLAEGGRQTLPYQGYRCDWLYEEDNIEETGIYMIWPQFLVDDGSLIFLNDIPIPISGIAVMWILSHQMRCQIHSQKIKLGVRGYFMEGKKRVAEAIVTEIIGLYSCSDS